MFKLLNTSTNQVALSSVGGSSAINLLGRFANDNSDILNLINIISHHEQQQVGDCILAEIVHLPESRIGNILSRPIFREYEIPYLAKASVDKKFQIEASDLFLSLKGDKILLWSKRLNKQIIPRLSNAHNFSVNALPIYHFLCDLQVQYYTKPYLFFNWGALANRYNFLPRVEYKNVVLSPARWQLNKSHFEILLKSKSEEEIEKLFYEFKAKYKLPDVFFISDGDNELLIDTKQPIAIVVFIDILKNRKNIILEEFLFDTNNSLVKDTNGNVFTNECIVVLLNENNKITNIPFKEQKNCTSNKKFSIGSEWLYYKIYCGVKTTDYILTEKIKPITEYLIDKKCIDKWFFIRYSDPENHLRFRLHIQDLKHYDTIINLINIRLESLVNEGVILKIQTDTYTRELNRYGDNSIELVESLFYYDSECCMNVLNLLDGEQADKIRWQFALRTTDQFLDDFGFDIFNKYELMQGLSLEFFREHGEKKELKLQLDDKYRKLRKDIEQILDKTTDNEKDIFELIQLINKRSINNEVTINKLHQLEVQNTLQLNINDLLTSFIHMMLNRVFIAKQRTNEFVIYDFLTRHYKSHIHRTKKQSNISTI